MAVKKKTAKKFPVEAVGMQMANITISQVPADISEYHMEFFVESRVQEERKVIIYAPIVKIYDKRNINIIVGSLEILIAYEITQGFEDYLQKTESGAFNVDPDLDSYLSIMSFHSLRGAALSEFRGTNLQKIVLPILGADSLQKVPNADAGKAR